MRILNSITVTLLCLSVAGPAGAAASGTVELESQARTTDTLAEKRGEAPVNSNLVAEFAALSGSTANAEALVSGLRDGKTIELVSIQPDGTRIVTPVEPGTKPMGWGNVFVALALTQQSLAQQGITSPTDEQLGAALTGGTITVNGQTVQLRGALALRASGMGWGQIAQSLGVKLGEVVRSVKAGNDHVAKSRDGSEARGRVTPESHGKSEQARADKVERVAKVDRVEKLDRPNRPERVDRPDRPERGGKAR